MNVLVSDDEKRLSLYDLRSKRKPLFYAYTNQIKRYPTTTAVNVNGTPILMKSPKLTS